MAISPGSDMLWRLRRRIVWAQGSGLTDGQLLERFVCQRDEVAFEALVARHGSMVLGVCQRVLRHGADAEDAFQAAFLVLAQKAFSIHRRELLGNWLYGVAYRTALAARAKMARRRALERQVLEMPERAVPEAVPCGDLIPLLDQELSRLPEKYRVPVLLCDLAGRTRKDVARQLGLPEGTLSSRLAKARRRLAMRLARHAPAVSVASVTAALTRQALAGVPPRLAMNTVRVALGGTMASSLVPTPIAALAQGVSTAMWMTRFKTAVALVLVAGSLGLGALWVIDPIPVRAHPIERVDGPSQEESAAVPDPGANDDGKVLPTLQNAVKTENRELVLENFRLRIDAAVERLKKPKDQQAEKEALAQIDEAVRRLRAGLRPVVHDRLREVLSKPAEDAHLSNQRGFRIPFRVEPGRKADVKELILYASCDEGTSWQKAGVAGPESESFTYEAEADGVYWFSVCVVDRNGRRDPTDVFGTPPQLKVRVDTKTPLPADTADPSSK